MLFAEIDAIFQIIEKVFNKWLNICLVFCYGTPHYDWVLFFFLFIFLLFYFICIFIIFCLFSWNLTPARYKMEYQTYIPWVSLLWRLVFMTIKSTKNPLPSYCWLAVCAATLRWSLYCDFEYLLQAKMLENVLFVLSVSFFFYINSVISGLPPYFSWSFLCWLS